MCVNSIVDYMHLLPENHMQNRPSDRDSDAENSAVLFRKYGEQIERFSQAGLTMFSLFNLHTREYVSPNSHYTRLLNETAGDEEATDDLPAFYRGLHPDDLPAVYHAERETYRMVGRLPAEARADYFLVTPVRMRKRKGGYRLLLRRIMEYKAGRKGDPWLLLIAVDVLDENAKQCGGPPILCNKSLKAMYQLEPGKACQTLKFELSKRELEVVELAGRGYTSKEIAEELFLSVDTIGTHRKNILRKTKTSNISSLYTTLRLLGVL